MLCLQAKAISSRWHRRQTRNGLVSITAPANQGMWFALPVKIQKLKISSRSRGFGSVHPSSPPSLPQQKTSAGTLLMGCPFTAGCIGHLASRTERSSMCMVGPTYHCPDFLNAEIQFFVRQDFNVLDPELSRQHRLWTAFPAGYFGRWLGWPRAGRYPHGHQSIDQSKDCRAWQNRYHGHILWRILVLVGDHTFPDRDCSCFRAYLRHD